MCIVEAFRVFPKDGALTIVVAESQEAVLGEQETELPEDLKLQIDAASREDLLLADKHPMISRQYIGKRRISSPGVCYLR